MSLTKKTGNLINNTRSTELADEFLFVSYYSTCSHDFYLVTLPLVFFFFLFIEATMLGIKAVNSVYSLPLLDM